MAQTASIRTNTALHTVKQGVKPVKKTVTTRKISAYFIFPDGTEKAESELTTEERQKFCQKALDVITPILYNAVMEDIRREQEAGA